MGILDDDLASIMGEAAEISAEKITIGENAFACEPGMPDSALAASLEADVPEISETVLIPCTEFTAGTKPKDGDRALWRGRAWRVVRVLDAVDGLEIEVGLGQPRR
jgi:hypothetical protein